MGLGSADGLPGPDAIPVLFATLDEWIEELRNDDLRRIVVLRLRGHGTPEIATELGTSRRTIERKLELVRCVSSSPWNSSCAASEGRIRLSTTGWDGSPERAR